LLCNVLLLGKLKMLVWKMSRTFLLISTYHALYNTMGYNFGQQLPAKNA